MSSVNNNHNQIIIPLQFWFGKTRNVHGTLRIYPRLIERKYYLLR